jgi:eukaryotic-like serine/threonine-protein kinase
MIKFILRIPCGIRNAFAFSLFRARFDRRRPAILEVMSSERTEMQGPPERHRARQMSLNKVNPPTQIPGYEPQRFLGAGAYGEVWVALERNTGRRVAVKFYAHCGGLDWSLLSREVEKLAFLFADRYVVQLLGVGWDSDPPYYIMEYLERGSLADRLEQGPLPVAQAVLIFQDVAVGLLHAHAKGVLHCDLKPANILLDADNRPRLADFGQSRLSHEQSPALGTLFYMAPEQADLEATPDASWDVYALGALLYSMLTGSPPHRSGENIDEFERTVDLKQRLARYRQLIESSPPPSLHRRIPGVDRALADIVDRCLAVDPRQRYANIQAVLDALRMRAARRARRSMMLLGALGPALLLAVVSWFAWQGFNAAVQRSDEALTERALGSNGFAAQYVARTAVYELERRFQAVEQIAASERFCRAAARCANSPEVNRILAQMNAPDISDEERTEFRDQFRANPERQALQDVLEELMEQVMKPQSNDDASSWFFCDAQGISTARIGQGDTVGRNFAWRSFFHGGPQDRDESWRPKPDEHIDDTTLSAVFRSRATHRWVVAVSTPVFSLGPDRRFLGVVALTVEVGKFVDLPGLRQQFAVLVDQRPGENEGIILFHPLFKRLFNEQHVLPDRFKDCRIESGDLPNDDHPDRQRFYRDPVSADSEGGPYRGHWLARMEPVLVRKAQTGWVVIVQQAYDTAIGSTLADLQSELVRYGLAALALVAIIMGLLWAYTTRISGRF